jgi:erythrin-vacuolar iron transport family protein
MNRKIHDLSTKEVLALAIHVEQENGDRLRNFAKAFDGHDPEVASKFRELAEEEDCHKEWLTQKFKRRFKGPVPSIQGVNVEGLEEIMAWNAADFEDLNRNQADQIYQAALEMEYRARKFYQAAESIAVDKSLILLFRQLAGMEDDHVGWLEQRIQVVL